MEMTFEQYEAHKRDARVTCPCGAAVAEHCGECWSCPGDACEDLCGF